jgi:hypothetical protein
MFICKQHNSYITILLKNNYIIMFRDGFLQFLYSLGID